MPVKVAGVFISSLIVFYAGIMSSRYVNEMVPDTRDVAAGWIEKWMYEDVSPDASIMLFGQYDSNLPYRVIKSRTFSDRISWSSSLDDMLMRKPDYIVVSSLNYDRYFQYKMYGDRYSMDLEIYYKFYRILFETHRPVMSFSSSLPRLGINNPVILVYRVDYDKLKALWTM